MLRNSLIFARNFSPTLVQFKGHASQLGNSLPFNLTKSLLKTNAVHNGLVGHAARGFSRSPIKCGGHGRPGLPGENFPMNFKMGKYKTTLVFILFFGIGLGAPWLVVMHQMTRK